MAQFKITAKNADFNGDRFGVVFKQGVAFVEHTAEVALAYFKNHAGYLVEEIAHDLDEQVAAPTADADTADVDSEPSPDAGTPDQSAVDSEPEQPAAPPTRTRSRK